MPRGRAHGPRSWLVCLCGWCCAIGPGACQQPRGRQDERREGRALAARSSGGCAGASTDTTAPGRSAPSAMPATSTPSTTPAPSQRARHAGTPAARPLGEYVTTALTPSYRALAGRSHSRRGQSNCGPACTQPLGLDLRDRIPARTDRGESRSPRRRPGVLVAKRCRRFPSDDWRCARWSVHGTRRSSRFLLTRACVLARRLDCDGETSASGRW